MTLHEDSPVFAVAMACAIGPAAAQVKNYTNVTDKMLENPSPGCTTSARIIAWRSATYAAMPMST
jgi:hypothetical protein